MHVGVMCDPYPLVSRKSPVRDESPLVILFRPGIFIMFLLRHFEYFPGIFIIFLVVVC